MTAQDPWGMRMWNDSRGRALLFGFHFASDQGKMRCKDCLLFDAVSQDLIEGATLKYL